jgi:hypothetical protein
MGKYSGKTCRLLTMLAMTASFFLVEIIVGYLTNSIALVADSFHMLSDVVALIVGFASVRVGANMVNSRHVFPEYFPILNVQFIFYPAERKQNSNSVKDENGDI